MKITKAMGRACLRELESGFCEALAVAACCEMGASCGECANELPRDPEWDATALAMCAAIAGVKP